MRALLDLVAAVVSPPRCASCDEPVRMRVVFCKTCAGTVVARPAASGDAWAPFDYGGALANAIHRFKYVPRADLARPLGDLLVRGVPDAVARPPDLVVPVPLHPARLVERGFNQAALLARPVARRLGARLGPRLLERVRDTPRQAQLDRVRRATNLVGAFRVRGDVAGRHVLLVDDVRTTGATLTECARALRSAGAGRVTTLVLAAVDA